MRAPFPLVGAPRAAWAAAVLLALAAAGTWPSTARAETTACVVLTSFPANITAPGHYCLDANVSQSFAASQAIAISADEVVLDCNGHTLRDTNPASLASGIAVGNDRQDVTVRDCVVDGFYIGIYSYQTDPLARTTLVGNVVMRARATGIYFYGPGHLIEGNRIDHVVGDSDVAAPTGIQGSGVAAYGNVLRANTITRINPTGSGPAHDSMGIHLGGMRNVVVEDNVIDGMAAPAGRGAYGIISYDTTGASVRGNTVLSRPGTGSSSYRAIYLQGTADEQATNVCVDNVLGHWNTNLQGCVMAGNTGH